MAKKPQQPVNRGLGPISGPLMPPVRMMQAAPPVEKPFNGIAAKFGESQFNRVVSALTQRGCTVITPALRQAAAQKNIIVPSPIGAAMMAKGSLFIKIDPHMISVWHSQSSTEGRARSVSVSRLFTALEKSLDGNCATPFDTEMKSLGLL